MRLAVALPSMLGSKRVCQKISLPLMKARLTPAFAAAWTFATWLSVQYSSCPASMKILWLSSKRAVGGGIEAGNIGNVVAVLLQPIDR